MEDKTSRLIITETYQKLDTKQIQSNKRASKSALSKEEHKISSSYEDDHKEEMNDENETTTLLVSNLGSRKKPH